MARTLNFNGTTVQADARGGVLSLRADFKDKLAATDFARLLQAVPGVTRVRRPREGSGWMVVASGRAADVAESLSAYFADLRIAFA